MKDVSNGSRQPEALPRDGGGCSSRAHAWPAQDGGPPASSCAVVDIHEIGWERLQAVSGAAGVDWWIELGGELLVCGDGAVASRLAATRPLRTLPDPVDLDRLWVARGLSEDQLDQMGLELVAGGGRLALVSLRPGAELLSGAGDAARSPHQLLIAARPGMVVVRQAGNARVDLMLQSQNLIRLASVDKTMKSQAILQYTVEGLSVIVIAYYLSGLMAYIFKGLDEMGWLPNADIAAALFVPISLGLALGIAILGRKLLKKKFSDEQAPAVSEKPQA